MEKTWYNRLLMSYFPILFITVSIIIFVSVSMMSEISIKETEKANRIFAKYVIDSMETSLKAVERVILEEAGNSDAFYDFFEMKNKSEGGMVYYETSKELHKILDDNPMIQSIYLYRAQDQLVLTTNAIQQLDNFQDKEFVEESFGNPNNTGWSAVRMYSGLSLQPKEKVISISKKALLPFGNQGIIVVNVRVSSLLRIVDEMINADITFMDIRDAGGQRVYPVELEEDKSLSAQGSVITDIHSDVIGWNFVSGIKGGRMFNWVSAISHIWLGIGIATVLFSIIYTLYVTRRNYKPIEGIMQQINKYQSRSAPRGKGGDEFSFIGKVLDSLMEQTNRYEKQYQEDLIIRRKQFFLEWIGGQSPMSRQEWAAHMNRYKLPSSYTRLIVCVAEIDGFPNFQQSYSVTDQNLLKFALTNVAQELADSEWLTVWAEWISDKRLSILLMLHTEEDAKLEGVSDLLDRFRTWVAVNLKFSLTVGVGRSTEQLTEVCNSFEEAVTALQYKMSLGNNQVIRYEEIAAASSGDTHKYFQLMDAMCHEFRISDSSWQLHVDQFAEYLEQDVLKGAEIHHLLQYGVRLLERTLEGLSSDIIEYWRKHVLPRLTEALDTSETTEELLPAVVSSLKQLHSQYVSLRDAKNHHQLASDIRHYIEDNYANPDLSLNLISDQFNVNGKYCSHLFKEVYGMKFVDFLMNLRMEQAKKLLLQTELPLQDISEKVGYTHSISFGRTFKKVVGVTPGDYRKYMQAE
ncbi:helix-turn-helix domain-containing protein [Paenibacillus sp. OAS669]|uniref:helix-turn-helix domain-containing protein n=1 Tax=Paenibacillus sp. OAS669 TaxID=2663821 RepID=UPI00178963D5|nr:helix-turn-helix domain-containing protein [Paenibacillus sp. OAS669]MBE1441015.1 YesN/AraC family two-component response regulator [Paenibacillus sp. OAS669]